MKRFGVIIIVLILLFLGVAGVALVYKLMQSQQAEKQYQQYVSKYAPENQANKNRHRLNRNPQFRIPISLAEHQRKPPIELPVEIEINNLDIVFV